MTSRTRKLIGAIALVAMIVVYGLAAMVYTATHLEGASKLAQVAIYAVAGFGWVVPAGLLVWWMQRPDPDA